MSLCDWSRQVDAGEHVRGQLPTSVTHVKMNCGGKPANWGRKNCDGKKGHLAAVVGRKTHSIYLQDRIRLVRAIPARASSLLQVFFHPHIKDLDETLKTLATSGMRWRWGMGYFSIPLSKVYLKYWKQQVDTCQQEEWVGAGSYGSSVEKMNSFNVLA